MNSTNSHSNGGRFRLGRLSPSSRFSRVLRLAVTVAFSAASVVASIGDPPTPAAADGGEHLTVTGPLPEDLSVTDPIVSVPAGHRIIVLAGDGLRAFDPETRQETAHLAYEQYSFIGGSGMPQVYAWTPSQARLYLLVYGLADFGRAMPYLAVVDPADPAGPKIESITQLNPAPFPPGIVAQGMSYDPDSQRLSIVGEDPSGVGGNYDVQLAEVDPATAAPTWPRSYSLGTACQRLANSGRQTAVHRLVRTDGGTTRVKVYFGCATGNLIFTREPGVPGIAGVDITNPAAPLTTVFPVSGSYATGESMYDAGAGRLILISQGTNVPSQAAWIFDEAHEVVTGVVSAGGGNIYGTGVDPVGGRVYVAIDGFVLTTTDRGLKIPQATKVPLENVQNPTITPIQFAHLVIMNVAGRVTVFRTDLSDYEPPPPSDPDAGTTDVAEAPGKTDATFGGDTKAFGARVHQVAGVNGVLQNVLSLGQDYWANSGGRAGVNDGDRDAYFARSIRARLSNTEASGSAVTTDGDANTKADYSRDYTKPPGSNDENDPRPGQVPRGQAWPYTAANCADFGTGKATVNTAEAEVTCDAAGTLVKVDVSHDKDNVLPATDSLASLASFGAATTTSTLRRDPALGMVVDTYAEAKDLVIGGQAHLGKVTSHAVSAAHGRPGTATASYERAFENVHIGTFSCTDDCDPQSVVDAMNQALAPAFKAELPAYEMTTTPRGAQGSVLREPWQHQQDVTLNNANETDLEIPALRVTYVGDNAVRSRVILEFGATEANSAYSIYRLSGDDGGGDQFSEEAAGPGGASPFSVDEGGSGGDGTTVSAAALEPSGMAGVDEGVDGTGVTGHFPAGGDGGLARRLGHGLHLLLTGRRALILNALLWTLLALPAFLSGRRRYLLRLIQESA